MKPGVKPGAKTVLLKALLPPAAWALVTAWLLTAACVFAAAAAPGRASTAPAPADYQAQWQTAGEPYKRALQASGLGRSNEALRDLRLFRARWDAFRDAFQEDPPKDFAGDRAWKRDLLAVSTWAEQAERELAAGEPSKARATLEKVRLRWMDMRSRQDACTYGDHLTRFHVPLQMILEAVAGKSPDTLTDGDIQNLRKVTPELMRLWLPVLDAPAGGLSATRLKARSGLARQVGQLVASLNRAVRSGDRAAILGAAEKLKPAFENLYLQFG